MAFYLKYRPQKIADLDLPEIREGLLKAVGKEIPHAFLFGGPRGAGKTSAARIIAKAANCLKNEGHGEPCGKCEVCEEISRGSFIDLIEIDGASNRGIDDVRSLRDNVRLAPGRGRFKVYIIDEVHMLTNEAFNALLKTLEEPPAHVIFILCTTEVEKLPETILSRCMRFNFRKATPAEMTVSLQKVIEGEKLTVEEGVLGEIAASVDGSFRDAQKILEQLAEGGKKIGLEQTQELLGRTRGFSPLALMDFLATGQTKESLDEIERLLSLGADLKAYFGNLLEILRLVLLSRMGVGEFVQSEKVKGLSLPELKKMVRIFSRAGREMKAALIPPLPLELAVVEWGQFKNGKQGQGEEKKEPEPKSVPKGPEVFRAAIPADLSPRQIEKKQALEEEQAVEENIQKEEALMAQLTEKEEKGNGNGHLELAKIESSWEELLELRFVASVPAAAAGKGHPDCRGFLSFP